MSMSTYVIGFRPPDAEWERMYKVWRVCQEADVELPDEVGSFFDYEDPDAKGLEVDLMAVAKEWKNGMREGYEIKLSELPNNITHIRFYNSW